MPTLLYMGTAIKHPVPDRVKPSFAIFDIRTLWRSAVSVRVPGCQKLQMIDRLTPSDTGCLIAVYPYGNSGRQRIEYSTIESCTCDCEHVAEKGDGSSHWCDHCRRHYLRCDVIDRRQVPLLRRQPDWRVSTWTWLWRHRSACPASTHYLWWV